MVPEVLEGSLMLASHSLLVLGVPLNRVLTRIRTIREERYGLFRGFFHGASDAADAAENLQPRLHSVLLNERAHAIGRSLDELGVGGCVEVTGVRRRGARSVAPDAPMAVRGGRRRGAARPARRPRPRRESGCSRRTSRTRDGSSARRGLSSAERRDCVISGISAQRLQSAFRIFRDPDAHDRARRRRADVPD